MEATLGPIIAAFITVTLPRFLDWLREAGQEFEALRINVQSIREEFQAIGHSIRDNRPIVIKDSRNFRKEWILPLRRLANKIEDCADQLRAAKTKEARDFLDKRIGELNEESKKKHKELLEYFSNPPQKKKDAPDPPAAHEAAPKAHHKMVGMQEAVEELRELVVRQSDCQSESKLRVICIVGFGGIGKTSLASEVIHKYVHTWVSASGKNAQQVVDEILRNGLSGANSASNKNKHASLKEACEFDRGKGTNGASTSNNTSEVMNNISVHGASTSNSIQHIKDVPMHHNSNTSIGTPQFEDVDIESFVETNSASSKKKHVSLKEAREFDGGKSTDGASTSNNTSEVMNNIGVHGTSTSNSIQQIKDVPMPASSTSGKGLAIKNTSIGTRQFEDADLESVVETNRYLIVIDDVQERAVLEGIISSNALRQDMKVDSTIIVTTTNQSVAYYDSGSGDDHLVYKVKKLSPDDQKDLFVEVAQMQAISHADEKKILEVIGRCDGLPLALVSIAEDVRREQSHNRCDKALTCDVCDDHHFNNGPNNGPLGRMQRVLFYSYHDLDSDIIKDVLLYFGMFPRGHPVKRNTLIRRWMAEGLVTSDDRSSTLNGILDVLIDRNIIQPIPESNINVVSSNIEENVKRCQPPGMMLEYISHQSKSEEFMRKWLCHENPPEEYVRRLTVHNYKDDRNITRADKFPNLRTLAVFPTKDKKEGAVGLTANFVDYKFLRVLDLEECDGLKNKHLEAICDQLLLLKYLSLGGSITEVPREIAGLKCLQTLDLRRCSPNMTVKVPIELFYKLPELKHLLGTFQLSILDFLVWNLEKKLSKGCNLQTLAGFVIGKYIRISRLMIHMMARLRKLKIWCKSTAGKANLKHVSETIQRFIRDGSSMTHGVESSMTHGVDRSLSIYLNEGCSTDFLDFSNEDPGVLTSLKLKGKLQKFPPFVSKLGGIRKLCVSSTGLTGDTIIEGVRELKILEYLKLVEDKLDNLVIQSRGESGPDYFQSLKRICLVSPENLPRIEIQDGALKFVVSLHLLSSKLLPPSQKKPISENESGQICSDIEITGLEKLERLEDITLLQGVGEENKKNIALWKEAARLHPNRPNVLEIEKP